MDDNGGKPPPALVLAAAAKGGDGVEDEEEDEELPVEHDSNSEMPRPAGVLADLTMLEKVERRVPGTYLYCRYDRIVVFMSRSIYFRQFISLLQIKL